ncbi:hypothetical protein CLV92_105251 [Kineococcus xinjiangensis]|uniref:Uncharacterized protein n=1 Tax=Kineococcus xinjiangensis TaxID=512762 RepID=A0A2S6IPJ2_9ACTN|nr:hypothetical protein [Kineococcus xinjiangensis]PPK96149.1 hypothetical protein CLV92_105251 [Kineococcus xinjiangensis]
MAQDEAAGEGDAGAGTRPPPGFGVRDGRYLGTTGRWWIELRVDAAGGGLLSADLHTVGSDRQVLRFSGRGTRRAPLTPRGPRWEFAWTLDDGSTRGGWVAVAPVPDVAGAARVRFLVESGDGGAVTTVVGRVVRSGDLLRDLGLEVEVEAGVVPLRPVLVDGEHLDVEECLRRTGFAVERVGRPSSVPVPAGGRWHGVDVLGQLHASMAGAAQASLETPAWEVHLLLLSRSDRPGLLGVMFDLGEVLPRQGAAVFLEEVRAGREQEDADRRALQLLLHETGHVLNLPHRFAVDRWNSTSFMNYDWCYRGGRASARFHEEFQWAYDEDELAFLRHGPRGAVIPGGGPFGAGTDWPPGRHGSTRADGEAAAGLSLWLTRGRGAPAGIGAGDPVFLEVSLANTGDTDVAVPREALDVKAGLLRILVRRRAEDATASTDGTAQPDVEAYAPVLHRCYALDSGRVVRLQPGESLHDNLNLSGGASGSPFAEPGRYTIQPVLTLPSGDGAEAPSLLVAGEELDVTVDPPPRAAAREGFDPLPGPGVRAALALGGTAGQPEVGRALEGYLADRLAAAAGRADPDPLVAAAQRLRGLELHRRADGDPREAAHLLEDALARGGGVFDPHTEEHTRRLAANCRARATGGTAPPRAVVELTAGDGSRALLPGVLRGNRAGLAWRVFAPAASLPPAIRGTESVGVSVTVAGADGLTERLRPRRVRLLTPPGDERPGVVVLELGRPVQAAASPVFDVAAVDAAAPAGTWDLLASQGLVPAGLDAPELDVAPWAAAAGAALAGRSPDDPPPVRLEHEEAGDVDGVALWVCRLLRICEEDEPPPFDAGRPFDPWPEPREGADREPAQAAW